MCASPEKCLALSCFGKFMHTVIAGWDDSECQRAFDAICQHTCILKNMKIVINSKPGILSFEHIYYDIKAFKTKLNSSIIFS